MVAVPPCLCLLSLYFSTLLNRELAVSLHKLRPKCIPTVNTSFTVFFSSIGHSLVLNSWSKEMTKLYCNFWRSICYQIVSRRRFDLCAWEFFLSICVTLLVNEIITFFTQSTTIQSLSLTIFEDSRQSLFQFLLEVVTRQLPT